MIQFLISYHHIGCLNIDMCDQCMYCVLYVCMHYLAK